MNITMYGNANLRTWYFARTAGQSWMMSNGLRERWAASFDTTNVMLYRLESQGDIALYITKDVVHSQQGNRNNATEDMLGRMPVYHIWKGDEWVYCGQNFRAAYNLYDRLLGEQNANICRT